MAEILVSAAEILGREKIPTLQTVFQKMVTMDLNFDLDSLMAVEDRLKAKHEEIERAGGIDKYIKSIKE